MSGKLFAAGCIGMAGIAAMLAGHALVGFVPCRNALGILFGRGELQALVKGKGIYQQDVLRDVQESRSRSGSEETAAPSPERPALSRLIVNAALDYQSRQASVPQTAIDREYDVLQAQFRDKAIWQAALIKDHFSPGLFRAELARNLRTRQLLEQRLVPQIKATPEQCRAYYDANQKDYVLPARFRARHLFLAAPPDTPPDVVDVKKRAIEMLATRLAHGENLADLAGLCSEDEATKTRGGDLGFFSEYRMPPDFLAAIKTLRVGETGPIVRTRLGFHIIQFLERKESRQRTFDEIAPEIHLVLENERRRRACAEIAARLSSRVDFARLPGPLD